MTSVIMKQTCAKCNKGGGIAMCNGCQQSFCIKHFVEHRQEISQQMDNIGQEHDLLRRDLNYEINAHSLLERINQWEQESIKTIQETAKNARTDLRKLLDQTKNEMKMSVDRLTEELRTCRESDDYTEIDIKKWIEQLKELRQIVENPSSINIGYDTNLTPAIPLIKVSSRQQLLLASVHEKRLNENNNSTSEQFNAVFHEKFTEAYGNITLSTDGFTGYCSQSRFDGSCISGICRYSSKIHHIRFQIGKKKSNYLFFGIITASQELTSNISAVKSAYGWWELGFTVLSGKTRDKNQTKVISSGDEVTLILDCDNRRIYLQHYRTNTIVDIPIDLEQCPFPWKIILRLDSANDCIKLSH